MCAFLKGAHNELNDKHLIFNKKGYPDKNDEIRSKRYGRFRFCILLNTWKHNYCGNKQNI